MIGLFSTLAEAGCPAEDGQTALIARAQRDPSAFAALYHRYVSPVFYYLLARVGSRRDAEDLTAQVFLEALESLPAYRHRGFFAAWLFTIARHRLADFHRRSRPEVPLDQAQETTDQATDPLTQVVQGERLQRLAKLVAQLDEDERELLRLRFAAGLRFAEVAAMQRRKESAVKMGYYRLLERLKSQMEADHA
jgi:RNA polymerase sigma-70 factor (ECF subfamily)